MTLAELAAASGVALSTLTNLEHQQTGCSAVELWKISLALDVPISDLCSPSRDNGPLERLYSFVRGGPRHPGGRSVVAGTNSSAIFMSSKRIH
jgi:transcriptional regulator with XRE-family HTH domain